MRLNLKVAAKALISSLIMALPLYFLASQRFEILLVLGIVVYFIVLYLLKGIDRGTLVEILSKKNETLDS